MKITAMNEGNAEFVCDEEGSEVTPRKVVHVPAYDEKLDQDSPLEENFVITITETTAKEATANPITFVFLLISLSCLLTHTQIMWLLQRVYGYMRKPPSLAFSNTFYGSAN